MEEKKKYNIGLDIGTSSVGWAVVESGTQKIIKKGTKKSRKSLWGVRMFEEASTAAERRLYRSSRRRYDRRRNRIKRLQNEFASEISKVDKDFFQKLRESKYHTNLFLLFLVPLLFQFRSIPTEPLAFGLFRDFAVL